VTRWVCEKIAQIVDQPFFVKINIPGLPDGMFCGYLVHFTSIGYILWPFGIFYGHLVCLVLVCCTKENTPHFSAEKVHTTNTRAPSVIIIKYIKSEQSPKRWKFVQIWSPCVDCYGRFWQNCLAALFRGYPGLPDFSWYKIPKWGEIYQMTTKYTKWL
jgi:hypothetical protein